MYAVRDEVLTVGIDRAVVDSVEFCIVICIVVGTRFYIFGLGADMLITAPFYSPRFSCK